LISDPVEGVEPAEAFFGIDLALIGDGLVRLFSG
jgi:hypothetical protein